jgi:hypothetical protein
MMALARTGLLALVLVVAGCSFLGSRTFGFSFPAEGNREALPVLVTDQTGSVVDVDEAVNFRAIVDEGVATSNENPNAVVIHWIGGACDSSVAITATGNAVVDFAVVTSVKPIACDAIGIPRAVRVQLSQPPDMARISVRFDP